MRVFCTYFDHNYLPRGLALHGSMQEHCPEFELWVLCLTGDCHEALKRLALPGVKLITLEQMELFEPRLTEARKNRSAIEYFFTCTPVLPLFVLANEPAASAVTYVDCDMFIFHPLDEFWEEIEDSSIAIVAHRFPLALRGLERWGVFNVGWLTFRRDANASACLDWWRDRCLEWCYDKLEEGRFADQKYLDDWPERFSGVRVIRHPGVNLAPWNLAAHHLAWANDRIMVDGQPLLVFHFHGLKQRARTLFDPQLLRYGVEPDEVLSERIYGPYLCKLTKLARQAGVRKEAAGLNVRGTDDTDAGRELSLRQKWVGRNQRIHEADFGGYMTVSPASVGVVISTLNSAHLLPAHLESMEAWLDLVEEIVVVDGHSTDRTVELLRERLRHPRVRILSYPGRLCQSWNFGISQLESDFTYIATVGDKITRSGMKHLLATARRSTCDIVTSPPRWSTETGEVPMEHSSPIEKILDDLGIVSPIQLRRGRMMLYAAHFALNCGFKAVLGRAASNLYRTEMLQAMPFPIELGGMEEAAWGIRNLLAASVAISPLYCSTILHHPSDKSPDHQEGIQHNLSRLSDLIHQAIDEALAQSSASDRDELLRVKEMVESMIGIGDLRRSYLEKCERLESLRSSLPIRFLWVLNPKAWRARLERARLKQRLLEAEVKVSGTRSQTAWR